MRPESYDGEKNKDSIEPPTRALPEMDVTSIELPTVSNILPLGKFSSFLLVFLLLISIQMFRSHHLYFFPCRRRNS